MNVAQNHYELKKPSIYSVYGLNLKSDLSLPELSPAENSSVDAAIVLGDVPGALQKSIAQHDWIEFSRRSCLLKIKGVGRFLIESGDSITVDRRTDRSRQRSSGTPSADIRAYLLGGCFSALLHQRCWLPLHIGAVQANGGGWAFTGCSGAGKSTLIGWMHRRLGLPIICDDVGVLRPDQSEPTLYPGPNRLNLCEDAVAHLGFEQADCRQDLTSGPKVQIYPEGGAAHGVVPLRALVVLDDREHDGPPELRRLKGAQAFPYVMSAIYRPLMAWHFRRFSELSSDIARLCNRIEVYTYRRRRGLKAMDDELRPLLEKMLR